MNTTALPERTKPARMNRFVRWFGIACALSGIFTTAASADAVYLTDGNVLTGKIVSVTGWEGGAVQFLHQNKAVKTDRDLPAGCHFVLMGSFIECPYESIVRVELDLATMRDLFSWTRLAQQVEDHKILEKLIGIGKPGGQPRPPVSAETAPPVISPVVGVWFQDSDGNVSANQKLTITIRPDGTYTKESVMRVPAYGIGNIPSSHNGTWTAQGMVVRLSGDGRYPGSTHDLSTFTRLQ